MENTGNVKPVEKAKTKGKKKNYLPYLMLAPWIIGFLVFKVYPIVASFIYSLQEYPILGDPEFVGIQNYIEIFTKDPTFLASFGATMKYVLIGAPAVVIVSFVVAAIKFQIKRSKLLPDGLLHSLYFRRKCGSIDSLANAF